MMKTTRKYYNIPEKPDFVRDAHSKGLLLTDKSVIVRHQTKKRNKQEYQQMRQDIDDMKSQMSEMMQMLKQIVPK